MRDLSIDEAPLATFCSYCVTYDGDAGEVECRRTTTLDDGTGAPDCYNCGVVIEDEWAYIGPISGTVN